MTTTITSVINSMGYQDWWCPCGVSPSDCKAAYQPKGAASYAASKVNLANPGTYDLSDGTAYPTWDATNGWTFVSSSSQYLTVSTNLVSMGFDKKSMVCKFYLSDIITDYTLVSVCNTGDQYFVKLFTQTDTFTAQISQLGNLRQASSTSTLSATTWYTGTGSWVSISDSKYYAYIDGGNKSTSTNGYVNPAVLSISYIGCYSTGIALSQFLDGKISACAFYNVALTDEQVLEIYNAIDAL